VTSGAAGLEDRNAEAAIYGSGLGDQDGALAFAQVV
jgi:hypothetical protein